MSRKTDLEHHIRESYSLIREYEAIIQTSLDRPEEKARARRVIGEQWALIEGYVGEYCRLTGHALPADVAEIVARFSERGYSAADRDDYLDFLIRQCDTLDLRLMRRGGQPVQLPLQEVYVALRADRMDPAERTANRALLDVEVEELRRSLGLVDLDPAGIRTLRHRVLVGHPLMLALLGRDRERLFGPTPRDDRLDLAEAFRRHRWLVILGDPGSGKTTLARWLALQLALALKRGDERVTVPARHVSPTADPEATVDLGPARLPLLVRVADFAEARSKGDPYLPLADFLGPHPWLGERPSGDPDALRALAAEALAQGRAVVILDGLDEITDAHQRLEMVSAIEAFIRDHVRDPDGRSPLDGGWRAWAHDPTQGPAQTGGNQVVITSRIVGYHAAPLQGDLAHFTIEPMDDDAINHFCRNWSLALHHFLNREGRWSEDELRDRADRGAQALKGAIHGNPGVRELAGNPLLLTLLAALHREEARLPQQRVRLYQRAVETLVEIWRGVGLSEIEFTHALAPLAYWLHANRPTSLALEHEVRRQVTIGLARYHRVDADDPPPHFEELLARFLRQAREECGLLLARGEALYGFLHLTFQEYFAARELTRRVRDTARRIIEHLDDPRWREPLLLAVAWVSWTQGPEDLDDLLEELLDAPDPTGDLLPRNAFFVAACIPEVVQPPLGIVRRLAEDLLDRYARATNPDSDTPFDYLRRQIETAFEHLRSGEAIPTVDNLLAAALRGDDPARRTAAARLIEAHGWASRELAEALLDARPADDSPRAWVSRALWKLNDADPAAMPAGRLPFRQALRDEPGLAERLAAADDWVKVVWTVYGNYRPQRIAWDSSLTPVLLPLLRARPAPVDGDDPALPDDGLRRILREQLEAGGPAYAHAALALAAVGETDALMTALEAHGQDPARRAEVEAAVVVLLRARDLDLARALARDLDLDLALAPILDTLEDEAQPAGQRQRVLNTLRESSPWPLTPALLARLARWLAGDDASLRETAQSLLPYLRGEEHLFEDEESDPGGGLDVWAASEDPFLSGQATLLGAELGRLRPGALPRLAEMLAGPHDLLRYRAALALNRPRPASALGAEGLESLAALAETWTARPEVGTYFSWALRDVEHDDPALLARYVAALGTDPPPDAPSPDTARAILGQIHRLDEALWPDVLRALAGGPAGVQSPLLDSLSWLLRLGQVPEGVRPEVVALLTALAGEGATNKVREAALEALGHVEAPPPEAVAVLLDAVANAGETSCRVAAVRSLGRLLSRLEEGEAVRAALEGSLGAPLAEVREAAAAALARAAVSRHGDRVTAALEELAALLPEPSSLLRALLAAGTDDDVWDAGHQTEEGYHTHVVLAVRALVGRQPDLLAELVAAVERALAVEDSDEWPPRRIALAALAACAEATPALFDRHAGRSPAELEALLVRGAQDAGSFTARRSALTALGYLRRVTPAVAGALLAGLRDVARVQRDAVAAVERFRQVEGDLLDAVAPMLEGESEAAAYGAARLLAALGRSPAVDERTRQAIRQRLAAALRRELARPLRRYVFLLEGDDIQSKGSLADALFEALAQVAGW